jgi:predicted RecB family endonuclease
MTVELCRLIDDKLSVRVDGCEVYLLPNRWECESHDLQKAFTAVIDHALLELVDKQDNDEYEKAEAAFAGSDRRWW